ncbi:MAG: elongation factor P [Mariprofundaceae bacterium]
MHATLGGGGIRQVFQWENVYFVAFWHGFASPFSPPKPKYQSINRVRLEVSMWQVYATAVIVRKILYRSAAMYVNAPSIRQGMILEMDGTLWRVVKTQHVTPGKGVACMQLEIRNVKTGTKSNKRLNSTERVIRVVLSQKTMQFLYSEGDTYHFMDMENYEQLELNKSLLADAIPYLLPETEVIVEMHDEQPLNVAMPKSVVLTVTACDAVIKGQTATSSYKPGVLETGTSINVPPYLEAGTKIRVNTETGDFMERV